MSKKQRIIVYIIGIALALVPVYLIFFKISIQQKPIITVIASDTLRFKVRALESQINALTLQRQALQYDNTRLKSIYNAMLLRINADTSDTAQYKILQQILHKPKPELIDVNIAIVDGDYCCELLKNTIQQLVLSDSCSQLKDTIIVTQSLQLGEYHTSLSNALLELTKKDQERAKVKCKLHIWRSAALFECSAIAAVITLYKLSH